MLINFLLIVQLFLPLNKHLLFAAREQVAKTSVTRPHVNPLVSVPILTLCSTPNIGKSFLTEAITSAHRLTIFTIVERSSIECALLRSDWFTKFAPLSQPMRTQTTRALLAHDFPRLAPVTSTLIGSYALPTYVFIGQSNYFEIGFTARIKTNLFIDRYVCASLFQFIIKKKKEINQILDVYIHYI